MRSRIRAVWALVAVARASVLVYPEGVMYAGVSATDIDEIIDSHVLGDQPVTRLLAPAEVW